MEVIIIKEEIYNNGKFSVSPGTRVKDLKSNIARGKDFSEKQIRLFYMDQELEDEKTLSDYKISNYSAIKLRQYCHEIQGLYCYYIHGPNGTYELNITPESTLCDLKNMIKDHENVDISQISLFNRNNELVNGFRAIGQYPSGSIFDLKIEEFREEMEVFVKTLTGKHITVNVKPTDTIRELKLKIQDKEGIPPNQQHICYKQIPISSNDDATVQDMSIKHHSTIHLVHRH